MTVIDHRRLAGLSLLLLAAVLVGCGGPAGGSGKKETSRVRFLTMLYTRTSSQLGRNPKDEQEFKEKLKSYDLALDKAGVSSIDELFISERDGQPLVVLYGARPPGSDVVVYEQTGVGGMRYVGHKLGMVEEVDEAKFRELVPAGAAPKAAPK
jgi:hypothetical protein